MPDVSVASMSWSAVGQLHIEQGNALTALGYRHAQFLYNERIPEGTDVVLVQGPYGTLVPLCTQLKGSSPAQRPVLVYWFQQSMQYLQPKMFNLAASIAASDLLWLPLRDVFGADRLSRWSERWQSRKARRLGFLGDLMLLQRQGLLDVLAFSSTVYADYLRELAIPSLVVPRGYVDGYGDALSYDRDVTLLWMGKLRTKRRRQWVDSIANELRKRGRIMHIYDGERSPFIFGQQRTELLNRSLFVLNLNSDGPENELSIRYYIAAANGAVIIREPNQNRYPFLPGVHLVECQPEEMPDVIEYYINNPTERDIIATNMLHLMTSELTLENSLREIMRLAEQMLAKRGNAAAC